MELSEAFSRRRSCRSYLADPIPDDVLDGVLAAVLAAPSVGNSWGLDLVVLSGPAAVGDYWDVTLPEGPRRDAFPWPGLLAAPVLVLPVVRADAYVERYARPDKVATGLGAATDAWGVPYWWVDGGAAVMALLLAATGAGLGSLLFGVFDHEPAVAAHLGLPGDRRILGVVALGFPGPGDRPSGSAAAGRPSLGEFVHRDAW